MEVDVFEPLLGVEAWTLLANAGAVTMTEDGGIGVVEAEALEEFLHRYLLCEGTGVGRFAVQCNTIRLIVLITNSFLCFFLLN